MNGCDTLWTLLSVSDLDYIMAYLFSLHPFDMRTGSSYYRESDF